MFDANKLRLFIDNPFGLRSLRCSWLSVRDSGDALFFREKVGDIEWDNATGGALEPAGAGWNYRHVLIFYYKGVKVVDYYSFDHALRTLSRAK